MSIRRSETILQLAGQSRAGALGLTIGIHLSKGSQSHLSPILHNPRRFRNRWKRPKQSHKNCVEAIRQPHRQPWRRLSRKKSKCHKRTAVEKEKSRADHTGEKSRAARNPSKGKNRKQEKPCLYAICRGRFFLR